MRIEREGVLYMLDIRTYFSRSARGNVWGFERMNQGMQLTYACVLVLVLVFDILNGVVGDGSGRCRI